MASADSTTQRSSPQQWQAARVIEVQGDTAAEFLQGYLTCDSRRLNRQRAVPMALCTVKGRVVANGWALALDHGVGLIVHESLVDAVNQYLKPYVTFSKCQLATDEPATLCRAGGDEESVWQLETALASEWSWRVCPISENAENCSITLAHELTGAGFVWLEQPVSDQFLPQMLNLHEHDAVDFDKGCYLGQEIVARAQFRGAVKRGLIRSTWENNAPQLGTKISQGTVVQVSVDPEDANRGLVHAVGALPQ